MGHNIWLEDPPIKSQSKPLVDVSTLIFNYFSFLKMLFNIYIY